MKKLPSRFVENLKKHQEKLSREPLEDGEIKTEEEPNG